MSEIKNIGIEAKPPSKSCNDLECPWHGQLPVRGRIMEGYIQTSRMNKTVIVRRDYLHLVSKYSRYERRHGKISARLPQCIDAKAGDAVRVMECRHLARNVSFVVIEKLE